MMLYLTMEFYDNILNSFQVIEQTINYHSLISKGITPKMYRQELGFCTSSDDALYFYEGPCKHLEQFSRLCDGWTEMVKGFNGCHVFPLGTCPSYRSTL